MDPLDYALDLLADRTPWPAADWHQLLALAYRTPSLAALIGEDLATADLS